MGAVYATVEDVIANGHTVTDSAVMLTVLTEASAMLRTEVAKYGANLDTLIASNEDIGTNAKMVVITASERYIGTDASTSGMSQFSESALGYTVSGTIAGGYQSVVWSDHKRSGLVLSGNGAGDPGFFTLSGL